MKTECYNCGEIKECDYTEDPYASEIDDDYTKHWICDECYSLLCDEV